MSYIRVYQDQAVVLKRSNTGETDRIVTLFTKRHGKIRALAKGIRRLTSRRSGHLELFNNVSVTLHRGKSMDIITEADTISGWLPFAYRLDVIGYAYYICELTDRLLPDSEPQPDIYDTFVELMASFRNPASQSQYQKKLDAFASFLLVRLGFISPASQISEDRLTAYIESIIERRLRTPRLIRKLHHT